MSAVPSEWVEPDGRDCPVADTIVVDIVRRDGSTNHGPAGYWSAPNELRHFNSWRHNGGNCDIVRYRIAAA
jgi:hypothetical protein